MISARRVTATSEDGKNYVNLEYYGNDETIRIDINGITACYPAPNQQVIVDLIREIVGEIR